MEFATLRASRRRFLVSAAAVTFGSTVLPVRDLLRAAAAQEAQLTVPDMLAFAESVELAVAGFYGAVRPRVSRPAAVAAATAFAKHHQDHAGAIGAGAGDKRTGKANAFLEHTLEDHLRAARNEDEVIKVAYDIENGLASTYLWLIDSAKQKDATKQAAAILPIEAQHAVVWGRMINRPAKELTAPDTDGLGFETEAKRLDASEFPTVPTTTTVAAGA